MSKESFLSWTDGETSLVARLAAGDERALGVLYDRFGSVAYGLAHAITSHDATAEAVVTDAFATVWREAHRYDAGRMTLLAWIATIVRDLALARRREARPVSAAPMVTMLSARQREMVELAFLQGMTRSEIAQRLQLTEGEVARTLREAADLLRSARETGQGRGTGAALAGAHA